MITFKDINVCLPDGACTYTLQAIGYSQDKAERKTKRHDNNLKNKAIKSLIASNLSENEAKNKMVFFSNLKNNKEYINFHNTCKQLYSTDEAFRNDCLESSKWMLAGKGVYDTVSDEAIRTAVNYFLAELPLYLNTTVILNVPSSLFVYKDPPPAFLDNIYNNKSPFSSLLSLRQGHLAINFN